MNNKIGDKIRSFRKRIGISQMELELRIEASPGSISRIESGIINPTKETIRKIAQSLKLNTMEEATLFELKTNEFSKLIDLTNKLNDTLDLDKILQKAVNEIVLDLGLNGAVLFLVENNKLYTKTANECWEVTLMLKMLKLTRFHLNIPIEDNGDNLVVKSIKDKRVYRSFDLKDYTRGAINPKMSDFLAKLTQHKSGIVIPLVHEDQSIGAMLFSKAYEDDFREDYDLLEALTRNVTNSILRAKQYIGIKEKHK